MSLSVHFHPLGSIPDEQLLFAIIATHAEDGWVFCRHRERSTWELPGGHIEPGEAPVDAAHRELYEETGTHAERLECVCVYSVRMDGQPEGFGLLCYAEVGRVTAPPAESEIAEAHAMRRLPDAWTYPDIQPVLLRHVQSIHPGSKPADLPKPSGTWVKNEHLSSVLTFPLVLFR